MEKELPKGWVETKLGVIAEWGSGGTPNRSNPNYYNGTIPWIKTGDLNNSIIFEASEYITELGFKKSSAKLFPKGSIVIAMYGATIGKTAKLGIDATTNQACAVAQASKIVIPEFLHYFLKSEKQEFIDKGKGGAQPNISQTVIKEHPFALPPFQEQQRIVAKLDILFGHLNVLETRLDRIPQLLKDFRQKVLNQAVTGKLTEDWREGRDLDNICNQINIIDFEIDSRNGWIRTKVAEISTSVSGYAFKSNSFVESGYPLIRMGNLYQDKLDLERNPVSIPFDIDKRIVEKYTAKAGTMLLSLTGTKYKRDYGYAIMVPEGIGTILVNQRILNLTPKINSIFFLYLLRSDIFRDQFFSFETGGVNQGNVSSKGVESIELAIPSMEEQLEIVHRVEALFAKSDRIEASYQKLNAKIEKLPQTLLAKAFRGKLVAQLPTDGDARELLKEIQKSKAKKTEKKQVSPETIANTKISNKMELEPIIKSSFKENPFSFIDLANIAHADYEVLQEAVFELLKKRDGWGLIQEFDVKKEQMMLKTITYETKKG